MTQARTPREMIADWLADRCRSSFPHDHADELLGVLAAAGIKLCPPGYVCVPEEASAAMQRAGWQASRDHINYSDRDEPKLVWAAMVKAAWSEQEQTR